MPERIRWKNLIAESIAVVASILVAFAIDAWWDGRQEAKELFQTLWGLDSELAEAQQTASQNVERLTVEMEILELFLDGEPRELSAAVNEAQTGLYLPLLRAPITSLETGFLDAAVVSGRIGLIENSRTRVAMTELSKAYADLELLQVELRRLGSDAAQELGRATELRVVRQSRRVSTEVAATLQENPQLRGYVSGRILNYEGYFFILARIGALHSELRDLVREGLGDSFAN